MAVNGHQQNHAISLWQVPHGDCLQDIAIGPFAHGRAAAPASTHGQSPIPVITAGSEPSPPLGPVDTTMTQSTHLATILDPKQPVNRQSQSQLGDAWWQAIYAIPADRHFGLFDDASDARGRRGSVEKALEAKVDRSLLFLGGGFGDLTASGGDAVARIHRTVVLPNKGDATVFLPILNASFDNLVNDPKDPNNLTGNLTAKELRDSLGMLFGKTSAGGWVSELFASLDGKMVKDPYRYRQASKGAFSYSAPYPTEDGILSSGGFTAETYLDNAGKPPIQLKDLAIANKVTIGPAVSDGYWLAVDITGGEHTLNFGGTLSAGGSPFFSLDVTYNILNPIYGGKKKDRLTGSDCNDYIDGGDERDCLFGGKGNDLMLGGAGRDQLDGGAGDDELWGDAGRDIFVFKKGYGRDLIFDFGPGECVKTTGLRAPVSIQRIDLASGGAATQVDFGRGDMLTFVGVAASELNVQRGVISFV